MVLKQRDNVAWGPGGGLMYEALAECEGMEELPDGYAMHYGDPAKWAPKLAQLQHASRGRWPALTIDVIEDPDREQIRLEIRGPEGTKRFVESANEMIHSYLNPAGSAKRAIRWTSAAMTSALRVLPDFLIIGAKKCGTTSLYWYLTQHPRVMPAFVKEVQFFNYNYNRGMGWYRRFFPTVVKKYGRALRGWPVVTGEATSDYVFFPVAAARVAERLPNARLIALLRNPIDRAYSAYHHKVRLGVEQRTFRDAVLSAPKGSEKSKKTVSYLAHGVYAAYLRHWYDRFPRDQILILTTEDLAKAPGPTVGSAFEFLGLSDHDLEAYKRQNAVPYPPMEHAVREQLAELFRSKNEQLYELLGRDLGWER